MGVGVGGLLQLQRELNHFNESFYGGGRSVDMSRYLVPIVWGYVGFNLVPTAVALYRGSVRLRRIALRNAAVPAVVLLSVAALSAVADDGAAAQLAFWLLVVAGFLSWISTMVDAVLSPTARPQPHHAAARTSATHSPTSRRSATKRPNSA